MYEQILLPYDGSDEAERGARHGIELAAALGASVHVLYVIDLPGAPRSVYIRDDEEEMREEYRAYGEEVTDEAAGWAAEAGVDATTAVKSGAPAEEIVDYAEDEDLDAIVIGSAYKGKLAGVLGGTSDKVIRSASVPVLVNRMTVHEP